MTILRSLTLLSAACVVVAAFGQDLIAEGVHVLPEGHLPSDSRLQPLKDLDGYFPFNVPQTRAAWERLTTPQLLYQAE